MIEPASLAVARSRNVDFETGTLFVAENRAEKNSRVIGVGFARFKSASKSDAPPNLMLPGGPGGSYVSQLADTASRTNLLEKIQRFRAFADVVLVDQRGFTERGQMLKYRFRTPEESLDEPANLARSTRAFMEMSRAAVEHFERKGNDLPGYTVKECADDVDDLRRALGYEKIALVGGSFGSQWSFAVIRRHPEHVARALLSGVEPLDCAFDMPSHVRFGARDAISRPKFRRAQPIVVRLG